MNVNTSLTASTCGAALDTDLMRGGGSDDTEVLQRMLDRALDGSSLHVLIDGPALVRGLHVHGNTTVEFTEGAGLYLQDGSRGSALCNSHPTRDVIVDRNIRIVGGFFNGNREGQTNREPSGTFNRDENGAYQRVIQFFGVDNLTIQGATIWNPRAFAVWISNAIHVTVRDVVVDVNIPEYPGKEPASAQRAYWDQHRSNLDGIHISGPARHVLLERLRLRTEDDAIALLANESVGEDITDSDTMGPYLGHGPISDVVVRDVVLDDVMFGVRLLSAKHSVDRVLFENVGGAVRHRLVVASNFGSRFQGEFGAITFRNMTVDPQPSATFHEIVPDWKGHEEPTFPAPMDEGADLALFSLNGSIRNLAVDGLSLRVVDSRPLVRLGRHADIGTLKVRALLVDPRAEAVLLTREPGSRVARLSLGIETVPSLGGAAHEDSLADQEERPDV